MYFIFLEHPRKACKLAAISGCSSQQNFDLFYKVEHENAYINKNNIGIGLFLIICLDYDEGICQKILKRDEKFGFFL